MLPFSRFRLCVDHTAGREEVRTTVKVSGENSHLGCSIAQALPKWRLWLLPCSPNLENSLCCPKVLRRAVISDPVFEEVVSALHCLIQ